MSIRIYHVDAFTHRTFAGNPAAVCLLPELRPSNIDDPRDEKWMQNVAAEFNLSETAFLLRQGDEFQLRWFTPTVEVDLCGHATLASAHVLWETGELGKKEQARFHTRSGLLTATNGGDWIEMNFPSEPEKESTPPAGLLDGLGVEPVYVGKNRADYLVQVASEDIVRSLQPDFSLLKTVPARGVMVTSQATGSEWDFVSRFFAPGAGILEDPVTGSAHCCLGPFWQKRLQKSRFTAFQASARGGVVRVGVDGDRVTLGGQAVTFYRGELAGVFPNFRVRT